MQSTATQVTGRQQRTYSNVSKTELEKQVINGEEILSERERRLKSIEFLTQYMEDLKAGRPVENISPSNDPYFLEPEVIASMIRGERDMLAGKGRIIKDIKEIIGEWDIE
jgi:hypothetical protein